MKLDKDWQRARTVHGWAFRDHTPEEVATIRKFLESGEREDLPEAYREMFDVVKEQKR